ncbi:MAG: CarD family transcriptional regulator [Deltaproteobacteria bacterium]|nr:CarD family transcriptional regulator [Deltaproteobacteria bacterium]MDP2991739.1 CarD family transcriptional regulator [Deltaproteobacteria bacterium]MDP3028079.1 CarD family transcriptional regulator [Deltaproteobacteria bacterium]
MFKKGELAVYPAHGVGVIESIERREFNGEKQIFYIMRIIDTDMVIMIPIHNAQSVGIRSIINKKEIPRVLDILKDRSIEIATQTWNKRYREYMDKIKTGSVFEVAAVLRDLYILKDEKPLSFGEKKMMDTAMNLLVKELSIARNVKEDRVRQDIEALFDAS